MPVTISPVVTPEELEADPKGPPIDLEAFLDRIVSARWPKWVEDLLRSQPIRVVVRYAKQARPGLEEEIGRLLLKVLEE